MLNLSDFKLDKIRKTIDVDINGEIQEVVIFNLIGEERSEIKNKIVELTEKGLKGNDLIEEIFTDIFIECTNIIVNEDIIDVLNAPTGNMLKILQEVYEIIHEIEVETSIESYQTLCQMEGLEYAKLSLLKAQHVQLISGECRKVENEINKFQKGVRKNDVQ